MRNTQALLKTLILLLSMVMLSACQSIPSFLANNNATENKLINYKYRLSGKQTVIGQINTVNIESDDSLPLFARHFNLGFDEITLANPNIDPWVPESNSPITLPTQFILPDSSKKGLVLNLAAKRLFYFPENNTAELMTFPIGIGRKGWLTPIGTTKIIAKKEHPQWVVPQSILIEHAKKGDPLPKVVAAGPNNPLGDYAIRLGIPGYLIHSTNKPYGVGMAVSHGCIRLYPENMEILFNQAKTNMPVKILNQPFLIGWNKQQLFIQVYPTSNRSLIRYKKQLVQFKRKLRAIERQSKRTIAWNKVTTAISKKNGIAVSIFKDTVANQPFSLKQPTNLNDAISPLPLNKKSWRIKVAEFATEKLALRFAAMLNHQGPQIPAHVLTGEKDYLVIAGPFNSEQQAKRSYARLRIDFSIKPELIMPGEEIAGLSKMSQFFSSFSTLFD